MDPSLRWDDEDRGCWMWEVRIGLSTTPVSRLCSCLDFARVSTLLVSRLCSCLDFARVSTLLVSRLRSTRTDKGGGLETNSGVECSLQNPFASSPVERLIRHPQPRGVGQIEAVYIFVCHLCVLCASACKIYSRRGAEDAERRIHLF
jgi:hypothetical protein